MTQLGPVAGSQEAARCLVLVGLPGSGCSTVGALVAHARALPLRDTDELIAASAGMPAAELLLSHGEQAYREAETAAVRSALAAGPAVVALGSGALAAVPGTAELLADHDVVWLRVTVANAISRAGLNVPRPAALGNIRATFATMAAEREPGFGAVAGLAVVTDYRPPAEVAAEVLAWWDAARSAPAQRDAARSAPAQRDAARSAPAQRDGSRSAPAQRDGSRSAETGKGVGDDSG